MLLIESIIKEAIEKDASDIHLIKGLKPILRIRRSLVEIPDLDALDEGDLYDIYDYIVRGNIEKDNMYSLGAISSDEEWASVKEVMKDIAKSEE